MITQNTTSFDIYSRRQTVVALMYFRLHIHKLRRSTTRTALVSETTNIISCDAPTDPQAVVFIVTFVTYLGQMESETGSGYPGNYNRIPGF